MTVRLPCLDCHKPEAERARAEIAQVYLETAAEAAGRANAMDLLPTPAFGDAAHRPRGTDRLAPVFRPTPRPQNRRVEKPTLRLSADLENDAGPDLTAALKLARNFLQKFVAAADRDRPGGSHNRIELGIGQANRWARPPVGHGLRAISGWWGSVRRES
jgi:hypothetical protein